MPTAAPSAAAILVAAGSGTRLGADIPKALVELGNVPLVVRAARALVESEVIGFLAVTAPPDHVREFTRLLAGALGPAPAVDVIVVPGGSTRQASVTAGLAVVPSRFDIVAIHDAARCLAPPQLVRDVVAAVQAGHDAVVPAIAVVDTIKEVDTEADGLAPVVRTPDRERLRAVQTPQGFRRAALERVHSQLRDLVATDDAAMIEAAGEAVYVIPGDERALKITVPADLDRAAALLATGPVPVALPRTGIGVDVHKYDADLARPMYLAGLHWPDESGLAGHSDGDVVAHAACDALLSAAGLGDLGQQFGTDDPRWRDAAGTDLLRHTAALVRAAGFEIGNVAVQLIAVRPRFGARRSEAEEALTRACGAPVTVSATTTDGLGLTGRGEGAAAIATALIISTR